MVCMNIEIRKVFRSIKGNEYQWIDMGIKMGVNRIKLNLGLSKFFFNYIMYIFLLSIKIVFRVRKFFSNQLLQRDINCGCKVMLVESVSIKQVDVVLVNKLEGIILFKGVGSDLFLVLI